MGEEIILDKELLKAIGAETRISILKSLYEHQKTQTDLAKELALSVPTVLEHLNQLQKAGLIEKQEEGRKWKYFSLTMKGKQLMGSSKKKISISTFIILGIVILFIAGVVMNNPFIQKDGISNNLDYSDLENGEIKTEEQAPRPEDSKFGIISINSSEGIGTNQTNYTNSTGQNT